MNDLRIEIQHEAFYPGSPVEVECSWELPDEPEAVELRLLWNTAGKGDRDLKVVRTLRWERVAARGRERAELTLPWGPYSFSGKLISLIWALELVVLPGEAAVRREITIGPEAREVLIGAAR